MAGYPEVLSVMKEAGIDLRDAKPTRLTPELAAQATLLITMGCGDECPYVPGLKIQDWPVEDPKGKRLETVRAIRDEISSRVNALVADERWN